MKRAICSALAALGLWAAVGAGGPSAEAAVGLNNDCWYFTDLGPAGAIYGQTTPNHGFAWGIKLFIPAGITTVASASTESPRGVREKRRNHKVSVTPYTPHGYIPSQFLHDGTRVHIRIYWEDEGADGKLHTGGGSSWCTINWERKH